MMIKNEKEKEETECNNTTKQYRKLLTLMML